MDNKDYEEIESSKVLMFDGPTIIYIDQVYKLDQLDTRIHFTIHQSCRYCSH